MSLPFKTEIIAIDGEDYRFYANPFTEYLRQHPSMLIYFKRDFPSGRPIYEATWKIEDGQLLMTGFYQHDSRRNKYHQLQHFFGSDAPKVADWYSGSFQVFRGEDLVFLTLSEYTGDVVIESGRLVSCVIEQISETDPRVIHHIALQQSSESEFQLKPLSEASLKRLEPWLN